MTKTLGFLCLLITVVASLLLGWTVKLVEVGAVSWLYAASVIALSAWHLMVVLYVSYTSVRSAESTAAPEEEDAS